ncbi:MAG: glycosyltransferase [Synergistaceae bacterium]|nr:glycosyltransferase [Synergistaceae bacterium]
MISIIFIRSPKAYLPEIDAYLSYFNNLKGFKALEFTSSKELASISEPFVLWEFKGFGRYKPRNCLLVHEYCSLSTPPFARIKNTLKVKWNTKPGLRVFLNQSVKNNLGFNDGIPFCFRDMGISKAFCNTNKNAKKEYDFVYVGSITKSRGIDRLLRAFCERPNGKLCLIGTPEVGIYRRYKQHKDIVFTGKVPYSEVPLIASKARYGINYIPNKQPYSLQTSTKLLEYLAVGLKVVTTDYQWVRTFEKQNECSFYKLYDSPLVFDLSEIESYDYVSNFRAEDYLWERVIKKSNIEQHLRGHGLFV